MMIMCVCVCVCVWQDTAILRVSKAARNVRDFSSYETRKKDVPSAIFSSSTGLSSCASALEGSRRSTVQGKRAETACVVSWCVCSYWKSVSKRSYGFSSQHRTFARTAIGKPEQRKARRQKPFATSEQANKQTLTPHQTRQACWPVLGDKMLTRSRPRTFVRSRECVGVQALLDERYDGLLQLCGGGHYGDERHRHVESGSEY